MAGGEGAAGDRAGPSFAAAWVGTGTPPAQSSRCSDGATCQLAQPPVRLPTTCSSLANDTPAPNP